jgi:hypothetical protein
MSKFMAVGSTVQQVVAADAKPEITGKGNRIGNKEGRCVAGWLE